MRYINNLSDFDKIPDAAKLDYNELGRESKFNLRRAMPNLGLVGRYIQGLSNPKLASEFQSGMRAKYLELKDLGCDSDEILGRLVTFVGGDEHPTTVAAAYVIVVYYFDACDIFENAPEIL